MYKCIKSISNTTSTYTMLYVNSISIKLWGKRERERQGYGKEKGHTFLNSPRLGETCDSLSGCESHCSFGNAQFHRNWPSDVGLRHCLPSLWSQTNWNHCHLILCNNQKLWSDNNQQPWNLTCPECSGHQRTCIKEWADSLCCTPETNTTL